MKLDCPKTASAAWLAEVGTGGASTTGSVGGSVYLVGGTSSASTPGNVILAMTSAGVNRGNVGIGTATPVNVLEIAKVASGGAVTITNTNYATSTTAPAWDDAEFILRRASGTPSAPASLSGGKTVGTFGFQMYEGGIGQFQTSASIQSSTSGTGCNSVPGSLNFQTNDGTAGNASLYTRMTISSSGNVGVGTMAPAEKLEVNGGVKLGTSANTNAGTLRWDGTNFQGYNGVGWVSFLPQTPPAGGCDLTQSYSSAGTFSYTVPASFGTITVRIWGAGGGGGAACSGVGGTGRVSIVCSSAGSTPANDRGIVFWNAGKHDSVTSLVYTAAGNVGVGTAAPQGILDVASTSSGVILPRMTKAQRNSIASPVAGMAIYQTDNTPGLRVYNGTNWMKFTETAD